MSNIETVYASKKDFNEESLLKWIRSHGLKPIKKAHIIGDNIRYRIRRPDPYKKFYTKVLPNGIHLVLQY